MHEASLHERNCFATLTYDNEHLPTDQSVNLEDWQLFAKRLRRHLERAHEKNPKAPKKFRYLQCAEYGDRNHRPHVHACLFHVDFRDDAVPLKQNGSDILYRSPTLEKVWGKGEVVLGKLTQASAAYVARYVLKKASTGVHNDPQYYRAAYDNYGQLHEWFVRPEFITMSRNPGLGKGWIEKYQKDVYPHDHVIMNGLANRVPRYYDDLVAKEDPELIEGVKRERRRKVSPESTTERARHAREVHTHQRMQRYAREL